MMKFPKILWSYVNLDKHSKIKSNILKLPETGVKFVQDAKKIGSR